MSSRRNRTKPTPRKADDQGDVTEQAIAELFVLWPRLEAALARDSGGPSDDQVRVSGGGGAAVSAAVVDLDTQRAMIRIEQRVQQIAGEARPLLGITNPGNVIVEATMLIAQLEADRQRAVGELTTIQRLAGRTPGGSVCDATLPAAMRRVAEDAAVTITAADAQIHRHRARVATAAYRRSTAGVLEQLRTWYPQLRDRRQPLAQHIADDMDGLLGAARAALGLRTAVRPLGRLCPHHRTERPTELIREADEAHLSRAVLAGREATSTAAPLRWAKGSDVVRCPRCKERWAGPTQLRVLMRMTDRADEEDLARVGAPLPIRRPSRDPILLPAPEIAIAVGRSDSTIRAWATTGMLTRRTVIDPVTKRARTMYDLDEAIGVSARARRRERGLIAPSQVGRGVPTRRS